MDFSGKTIVVAVTGGIAAYKAYDLVRELYRRHAEKVYCLLTPNAEAFVSALTFQSLSRLPVHADNLEVDVRTGTPLHILMAQQADALLIVPATADTIANLAHGMADNIVTTTALTFSGKPVLVAPAMNTRMWENPVTRRNIETLETLLHYTIIPPTSANLACGETGEGHLAEQDQILRALYRQLHPLRDLYQGKKAVVTAGGTTEPIDPARVISNRSSGKMGFALADELYAMGADVTLITTRLPESRPYTIVCVQTALEMQSALNSHGDTLDFLWMAAAISDYRVEAPFTHKLKRNTTQGGGDLAKGDSTTTLKLVQNPDILADFCAKKHSNQFVVGFAAESDDLLENAMDKLKRKKVDALVANDISQPGSGFESDHNQVALLTPNSPPLLLDLAPKYLIARRLLEEVYQIYIGAC